MLNAKDIQDRAIQVLVNVSELPPADALQVLHAAMGKVMSRFETNTSTSLQAPVDSGTVLLFRRSPRSRIESDDGLRIFLHNLPAYHTLAQLEEACVKEFGVERAPSKSAIHRYLQRLKFPKTVKG